jgi:6-phosphofructokinase
MKIGILTSGGDCPGLNAVIRGAVLKGIAIHGHEFVGFLDGWRGVVEGDIIPIPRTLVRGIAKQGGTILGTSRTNPFENGGGPDVIKAHMDRLGIDAIIAIGGEGTLAAAKRLTDAGLKIVGVPKTVDNDLDATDYTFGFDTAVQIATEAIDRLRTTGESHHRCMIAEVMGRHVGWIALHAGMASGAHAILIPEQKTSIEQITKWVTEAHDRGRAPLVVVAEGVRAGAHGIAALRTRPGHLRPAAPGRDRRPAGPGNRSPDRHRNPRHHPGPHPARRRPVRLRPRPGHPAGHGRRRLRGRRPLGHHGVAERHRH